MIPIPSLLQIVPKAPAAYLEHLFPACQEFGIDTPARYAMFLAQICHESAGLTRFEENLNYSAQGLMATWANRFPTLAAAKAYVRQPEKIANKVYADRMGNGPESSGDGWRFRGRGPIQVTGRENYARCGAALSLDLINAPELIATPDHAFRSAAWFWSTHPLNACADGGDIKGATRIINGGLNGLAEREAYWRKFQAAFKA